MRAALPLLVLGGLALTLAACSEAPPKPRPVETEVPAEFRRPAVAPPAANTGADSGTPMQERVATIGLLNKRNNISQDLQLKPGETRRLGDVIIALKACERTAPWEMPQETGAFVQVFVQSSRSGQGFGKVFSGWLFRESPGLNVVEHPVYDVWVKDCAMRFPGEEAATEGAPAASGSPATRPSAAATATPTSPPTPTPTASAPNDATA